MPASESPSSTRPQRFGRYHVVELIGSGAMGAVYLARDETLGRQVAVKAIREIGLSPAAAEMSIARFQNEARAVAALSHPHVVQIFDMGVEGQTPYLVMEVVAGASLRDRIEAGRPPDVGEAVQLCAQIGGALAAAHRQGIIHRDIKPANILEAEPGVWKLADFGVARLPDSSLTLAGQFLGSPAYAAPEAIQRGEVLPATDVYGLGATIYAALVGEPPYGPRGLMTPGALAQSGPAQPLSARRPDVPAMLDALIMRAVGRNPDARPSAAELAAVLATPTAAMPAVMATGAATRAVTSAATGTMIVMAPGTQSRRRLWLAAVIGCVLLLGIAIGSSDNSSAPGSGPGVPDWQRGVGAPIQPAARPIEDSRQRDELRRKMWKKVADKVDKGQYSAARDKLGELLREFPDDQQAQQLYRQLGDYDPY